MINVRRTKQQGRGPRICTIEGTENQVKEGKRLIVELINQHKLDNEQDVDSEQLSVGNVVSDDVGLGQEFSDFALDLSTQIQEEDYQFMIPIA